MGLEDAISQGLTGPTHDWQSWTFDLSDNSVDPVLGLGKLRDAYMNRFPDYPRGITVPAIVDIESKAVVTNDFRTLVPDLGLSDKKCVRSACRRVGPFFISLVLSGCLCCVGIRLG